MHLQFAFMVAHATITPRVDVKIYRQPHFDGFVYSDMKSLQKFAIVINHRAFLNDVMDHHVFLKVSIFIIS